MKRYLTATAALLVFSAQAQLSGPNRVGPGTSPGTFQTPGSASSSIEVTTPDSAAIRVAPPVANPVTGPQPLTPLGSPDARPGAVGDSLRSRTTFPSSRDWETGVGASATTEIGSETQRRLTPSPSTINPDLNPRSTTAFPTTPVPPAVTTPIPPAVTSPVPPASTRITPSTSGTAPAGIAPTTTTPPVQSDLNTTGVNTPPRANEQPLDRALSAKIRAQLSQMRGRPTVGLAPETIRDMRITSQGGKVILEGNVGTAAERQMVEVQARRIPGVVAVENRLSIGNQRAGAPPVGQVGQSPGNATDLNDDHPALSPEVQ